MRRVLFAAAFALALPTAALAQTESAFVYQGSLNDNGVPADGAYNIDITLWDAASGGNQLGPEIEFNAHPVSNGVFLVELDFGDHMFSASNKWLEFSINGTELSPRTPIATVAAPCT